MKEKLRDFLKSKKCHDQFVTNFKKEYRNVIKDVSLVDFLNTGSHRTWIRRAFEWDKTPEKVDFWSKINKEWLKCYGP